MIGIMVTVNGMLSTMAKCGHPPGDQRGYEQLLRILGNVGELMTEEIEQPDPSTPPTIMNRPAKNTSTAQSSPLSSSSGSGRTSARATATPIQET